MKFELQIRKLCDKHIDGKYYFYNNFDLVLYFLDVFTNY